MRVSNVWWSAVLAAVAAVAHAAPVSPATVGVMPTAAPAAPDAVQRLARRIVLVGDHGGLPFAIVDKRAALLLVYHGNGRLAGGTPALLGQTAGDGSAAGVGERAQLGQLRSGDRTTPAGRFVSEPGHNHTGESVVWIDYASALAIHRLRPGASRNDRALRLASAAAQARRVTAGCVVVPEAFYDAVVRPVLGRSRGVVYVVAEDGETPDAGQALTAPDS